MSPISWLIDIYIRKVHSTNYIHKDEVKAEIEERIRNVEDRTNAYRDQQESYKLQALVTKHTIREDGYLAEIKLLNSKVEETMRLRKEVEDLHFRVIRRARELALVTAENQHEGAQIINNVSQGLGRLDKITMANRELIEEINKSSDRDENALRIK
jgi:hypothetical protein